jgi:ketosteroid isomerase-like protein
MNPRITAALASALALFAGCSQSGPEKFKSQILAADKAFSEKSAKDGPKAAFLAFIAADGRLLSNTRVGADAVNNTFIQLPPTATLTWEPSFADVAASGDLGYTWGRYTLNVPSPKPGQPPFMRKGTYTTIWKRQAGGGWKFVLDGGSPDGQK